MKYPPKHFQETNFENIIKTIQQFPLATIISAKDSKIWTTHLPLIYNNSNEKYGKLIGHIDKFNEHAQWLQNDLPCSILFHGPEAYISPSLFEGKHLPTYNYIKVHIDGNAKRIENADAVKESIVTMTKQLEGAAQAFVLQKDDVRMARLIDYIVGFEITITSWEGKFKLSQDKTTADKKASKAHLKNKTINDVHSYVDDIYNSYGLK